MKNETTQKNKDIRGLGVFLYKEEVYLFFQPDKENTSDFHFAKSQDGFGFTFYSEEAAIEKHNKKLQDISVCSNFEINRIEDTFILFYKQKLGNSSVYYKATSNDLITWQAGNTLPWMGITCSIVSQYRFNNKYVMYVGAEAIHVAYSDDLETWTYSQKPILSSRADKFDNTAIEIQHTMLTEKGILLIYHCKKSHKGISSYRVGAVLLDKDDPTKILWRSNEPIWDSTNEWKNIDVKPLGIVEISGQIISYWQVADEGIFAIIYSLYGANDGVMTRNISLKLKKPDHNPILSPNTENSWEAFNTFNPAAFYLDDKVHLLYRAQGFDYISVLGYAVSYDGMHVHERYKDPVYTPHEPFEFNETGKRIAKKYVSGGGYGGCEDPRITQIGDRLYMTYVAFDGWSPPRVAMTSISVEDFRNQKWLWERPVLISPPGIVNKNACIFPEKIHGKYVILHRVYPDILVDFVDDLNFDGTKWLEGQYKISPRKDKWDSRKIGAGPPPIKTKDGWLLIYQSVGNQDSTRYKVGAMLLDLDDPTKVLHRSDAPILEPVESYENHGFKSGVAYPCGAVVINGILHVYYGGADSYVCVATANLDDFLAELKYSEIAKLDTVIVKKVL